MTAGEALKGAAILLKLLKHRGSDLEPLVWKEAIAWRYEVREKEGG